MQDTSRNTANREIAGEVRPEQTDRREVLATIGRFAYVAPALALLAQPKFAHAGYGRGGGDGGGTSCGGGGSFGGGTRQLRWRRQRRRRRRQQLGGGNGAPTRRRHGGGSWFKFW